MSQPIEETQYFKFAAAEVKQISDSAGAMRVKTADDLQTAFNMLNRLRRARIAVTNQVAFFTNPLKQQVKAIERKYAPFTASLATTQAAIEMAVTAYRISTGDPGQRDPRRGERE